MSKLILGNHYLIDCYNCDRNILSSVESIKGIMLEASGVGKLNIVGECFHQFEPYGVSGVLILRESHFTIHTWPEYRYASVDLYLCDKNAKVNEILKYLERNFKSSKCSVKLISRGINKKCVKEY